MTSANDPGPADYDLARRLERRGIKVDPGRLRRLRSEQQILGPDPLPDGSYLYSSAAEDYAARFIDLLAHRRSLTAATLTMFGEGFIPRERALKIAYLHEATATQKLLRRADATGRSLLWVVKGMRDIHLSRVMRSEFGRSVTDRLQRLTGRGSISSHERAEAIGSLIEEVSRVVLTGSPSGDAALERLLDLTGISAMQRDRWPTLTPIVGEGEALVTDDLRRVIQGFQLHRFVDRLRATSMQDLRRARDDLSALHDLFFDAAVVFTFLTSLSDAFGFAAFRRFLSLAEMIDGRPLVVARYTPLMLIISDEIPDYDKNLHTLLDTAPQLRAAASFVEYLPREYRRIHGVLKIQELPQSEQRQLVMDWARAYPNEARIAGMEPLDQT